jgi:transposase
MIRRMVGPDALTPFELGRECGIAKTTLSRWLEGAASIRVVTKKKTEIPEALAPTDPAAKRAQFVLEAAAVTEQELGELLRRRGLHREQLEEWRAALEDALTAPRGKRTSEGKRIRELEREVAYKDKALAETAALLVLQKNFSSCSRRTRTTTRTRTKADDSQPHRRSGGSRCIASPCV